MGEPLSSGSDILNIPGMLLSHTACSVPDENVYGDPFWTIMKLTKEGKNTGSYYLLNELIPKLKIKLHNR